MPPSSHHLVPPVTLRRVSLMVSLSASHVVGRRFAPRPGHTKDHQKNGTDCLPASHACVSAVRLS